MVDLSRKIAEHEQQKNRHVARARQVSALLNKAGVPKASRSSTWGREHEGFSVHWHWDGTTSVYFTSGTKRAEWQDRAVQVLQEAGWQVETFDRPSGPGGSGGFMLAARQQEYG